MRIIGRSVLRLFALALLVYMAFAWFRREGQSQAGLWLGVLVVVLVLAWVAYSTWRAFKARREAQWERAIYEPALRERAMRQISHAIARKLPVDHRTRSEHARLSVLLAELFDAQNKYSDAMATIDAVDLTPLSALERGLVRHTRAVTHLRASDAHGALSALGKRDSSGDLELDQRLSLLEAYAHIELGEVQRGLAEAEQLVLKDGAHSSVVAEARVVRAAGLDALGRREEALVVLTALGRDTLVPLSEHGQPRARALAKLALESLAA